MPVNIDADHTRDGGVKLADFSLRSKLVKKPGAQLEMTWLIKVMLSPRLIPIANRLNSQENVSRFPCGL
ncbi:MAG: hypothetical protein P1U77_14335 [Rubripirellula sp.]|jgi:hypothetical protein|nr:hypothetical protein [Rubripirellula sp.]